MQNYSYTTKQSRITLPDIASEILRFAFAVILMGIILSITSNYIYDKMKDISNDPNKKAINESKLIGYILPEEKERRTKITIERMHNINGEVCLLSIAATSYLDADATPFSNIFIEKLVNRKISLRLILLNPYSQTAKFRYAREIGDDVDSIGEKEQKYDKYQYFLMI